MYWLRGGSTGRELIWREMLVSSVTPREEGAMLSRWMHWCLAPRESQEDDEDAWDRKDGLKKKIIKILHNYVTVFCAMIYYKVIWWPE